MPLRFTHHIVELSQPILGIELLQYDLELEAQTEEHGGMALGRVVAATQDPKSVAHQLRNEGTLHTAYALHGVLTVSQVVDGDGDTCGGQTGAWNLQKKLQQIKEKFK